MAGVRQVTAAEKAEIERVLRERDEAEFPAHDIIITIGDETDSEGKVQVNIQRNLRMSESLELWPKRR